MTVTFSGLASGLDTASIVESLMEIESAPITTMENKQEYLETKLEAYTEFNTLLETLSSAVSSISSETDLVSFDVSPDTSDSFSLSTSSITEEGSYAIEVVSLAQKQKDISSEGFAASDQADLTGSITIGGETLEYEDVSLTELVELINEGEYGLSASIVNDGTENGYRMLLTADNAGEEIEIAGSGSIEMDTAGEGHTVEGTKAHVIIDNVDYYSSGNTITTAIKGVTIELTDVSTDGAENVAISSSTETTIATQMEEIVSAYNAMKEYIDTIYESDSTLANSMGTILRGLKTYLGNYDLVSLGIETDWETGSLSFDSEKLSDAYAEDPEAVVEALLGEDGTDGVILRLEEYMETQLDSSTGFLATRESTIESQIARLDENIEKMEARLEKRQETLEAQFTAMETLISSLNTQADFLTNFFESYSS